MTKTEASFIIGKFLPVCGCGHPEYSYEVYYKWLSYCDSEDKSKAKENEMHKIVMEEDNLKYGMLQTINEMLDDKDITEHGSYWGYSWLTDRGKKILEALKVLRIKEYEFDYETEFECDTYSELEKKYGGI